jgi:predicted 3-demethylubiquinone-9 3-methyltransferase (glyoxalase superfamily)
MSMQKIVPHLWFDKEAKQAAEFYTSIFSNSKIVSKVVIPDTPSGDTEFLTFELAGYTFMAISAGPLFKINPSISFMVNFDPSKDTNAKENLNKMWKNLSDGGQPLMPLQEYPFSKWYGWIQDKFGISWQLILTNPDGEERPFIIPSMMFVGDICGKAEEATDFYLSVFRNSKRGMISRYGKNEEPNKEGTVNFTDFMLEGQWFTAMDSALMHDFKFNEAISFLINCDTQEEIDYYWEKLSSDPNAEQCGWLKDKYGFAWQVSPTAMNEMMEKGSKEQIAAITQAFLPMKKLNIVEIEKAYKEAN